MNINDKEHAEIMRQFEKDFQLSEYYVLQEPKRLWPMQHVYAHDGTNKLFLAYRMGYSFGKSV